MVLIIVLKAWQLYKFDLIRAIYNYEHGKFNFNISNWILYNLLWTSLIHGHFYFFNFIFEGQTEPCVGMKKPYDSTTKLFNDIETFKIVYLTTICLQFGAVIFSAIMIGCSKNIKYNKIVNPIIFFAPLFLAQLIIIRIGVLNDYFAPNALHDTDSIILNYFSSAANYVGVLGTIPELMLIG